MFDEEDDEDSAERAIDPAARARDKSDEFRMHAELAAVFEGHRKFDAALLPGLDPQLARDVQRTIGRLDKTKPADSPVIPQANAPEAADLLTLATTRNLS